MVVATAVPETVVVAATYETVVVTALQETVVLLPLEVTPPVVTMLVLVLAMAAVDKQDRRPRKRLGMSEQASRCAHQ